MFLIYQILLSILLITSPIFILFRILKKKEHKKRFIEKYSLPSKERKDGKLIWFHGASVGEILSIIPLVKLYEKKMLKNDKSISKDNIIIWEFSLTIAERSLTGKKPPDEISENAKFNESNDLIEKKFRIIKINNVSPEYKKKILIACL